MPEYGSGAAGRWVHHRAARQNKDERKKHQEWKKRVGYNSKWMVKIIIYLFKRLLGKALWAAKPEYMMIDIATKITMYDKTRDVMRKITNYEMLFRSIHPVTAPWLPGAGLAVPQGRANDYRGNTEQIAKIGSNGQSGLSGVLRKL